MKVYLNCILTCTQYKNSLKKFGRPKVVNPVAITAPVIKSGVLDASCGGAELC